jgi:7-carboxy-7-deazaguanine synthase
MIRIQEIFTSIDGEVNHNHQGCFSTFIRFNGCNLRCKYCDTKKAQQVESGKLMLPQAITKEVQDRGCPKVTITGGEPLYQAGGLRELIDSLLWNTHVSISVETNGSYIPFRPLVSGRLSWVMDYKLPSSGMQDQMLLPGAFAKLTGSDFIKFVIMDRKDYQVAKVVKKAIQRKGGCARISFSPVWGCGLDGRQLIDWCKEDKLFDVIINLQLHKILSLKEGE